MTAEVASAYNACRARIVDLVSVLDDDEAALRVPACPDWSIHDVVAHLAGGVDDVLAGRLDGLASDAWTAAQIEARRTVPLKEIVAEWNEKGPAFEGLLARVGRVGVQAVADIASHEQDVRGAMGVPGARDTDAIRMAFCWVAEQVVDSASRRGMSLRVSATDGDEVGAATADAILAGETFELLRAITGRRTVEQLREMRWTGDRERAIEAFWWSSLHPAETPIDE